MKDNDYFIYEIIVGDNKGNLYYLDSDDMYDKLSLTLNMIQSHQSLKMRRKNNGDILHTRRV